MTVPVLCDSENAVSILTSQKIVKPQAFAFDAHNVRVLQIDGEPWFVAADVCGVLDLDNISMACSRLDGDERGIRSIDTPSGYQQMLVISESGLYSLTLTSRKPDAKRFKKWITAEVLPSIRKTGSYGVKGPSFDTDEGKLLLIQELATKQLVLLQENKQITVERDYAIKTKAWIGDKKTATAMATASGKSRELAKLKALVGEAAQSASVIAVQNKTGNDYKWHDLKSYCTAAGLAMGRSFNPGLQMNVNTYPAEAWFEVYGVDLAALFGLEVA